MKNMRKGFSLPLLFVISIVFLVSGCSDPESERTLKSIKIAEDAVTRLESTLKQGEATLPNLNYLRQYAQVASTLKPEMAQLISTLELRSFKLFRESGPRHLPAVSLSINEDLHRRNLSSGHHIPCRNVFRFADFLQNEGGLFPHRPMPDRSRFITLPQNRAHRFLLRRIKDDRLVSRNFPQTSADKIGWLLVNSISRESAPPGKEKRYHEKERPQLRSCSRHQN